MTSRKWTVVTLALMVGCGGKYLTWKAKAPAPTVTGKVAINVTDARTKEKDHRVVGLKPGYMNIPMAIRLEKDNDVADAVKELFTQAALASGIGVALPTDTASTAKIAGTVQDFWCQGVPFVPFSFTASIKTTFTISDPGTGAVRSNADKMIFASETSTDCQAAFSKALNTALTGAMQHFGQADVKGALTGAAPAAAPAAN